MRENTELVDGSNTFELALKTAASLPTVHIHREQFLTRELKRVCTPEQLQSAIEHNPAYAGIPVETIHKIAAGCINYETNQVSAISFVAGSPADWRWSAQSRQTSLNILGISFASCKN